MEITINRQPIPMLQMASKIGLPVTIDKMIEMSANLNPPKNETH